MFALFTRLLVRLILVSFFLFNFYSSPSRLSSFKSISYDVLTSSISSPIAKFILFILFIIFCLVNLIGNIPLNSIPTIFYSVTFTVSLLFWLPLIICVRLTQLKDFLAHLLPYGSPVGLMLLLPVVELFSQLIRPLTLMIRLRTNLSSGHIMMYIFSYFTLLSSILSPFIYIVLYLLFILELCISLLQAYIFVSLVSLYINETV